LEQVAIAKAFGKFVFENIDVFFFTWEILK
jgi:hypothetical protein